MIDEYGWSIVISVYLVWGIGTGILLWVLFKIWEKVFTEILTVFKLKKAFIDFIIDRRKKKSVYTPKLKKESERN
ncbi:hypothetical protein BN1080_02091 [Planococcus massiliensis]|uniref:Uncharacterized protein n=1 Tax=Planococcus massiliensis TaxID=1499687 RepID=A0A098EMX8_9BACL|nr:hypothetical protein [Planococcus massiliensis]CEG23147.1 hypothetical protein BN1080_02091 [Planococcus massiliensis]